MMEPNSARRERGGAELREARDRIRLLEHENEDLRRRICRRRTCREKVLPGRAGARRRQDPCRRETGGTSLGKRGVRVASAHALRQPFCRWLGDPTTESEVVEAHRANALFDAHQDDPEFGRRLLADEARHVGHSMADLPGQLVVERIREEARQERQEASTCSPQDHVRFQRSSPTPTWFNAPVFHLRFTASTG